MHKILSALVRNILARVNVHASLLTDKNELLALLRKLKPVYSGKALIRLGPHGDSGYLVPDDLEGISACFSPGVGKLSGFEKDCADLGMQVFLADKSVAQPPEKHSRFRFENKFIGASNGKNHITLDQWVLASVAVSERELILQMDIEGGEYEVFLNASNDLLKRFRIIVVEFHALNELWNKAFFDLAATVFDKLLQTHTCVHNHPNNCCGSIKLKGIEIPLISELTFLRNDRLTENTFVQQFPNPLDVDNTENPFLALPECWYK